MTKNVLVVSAVMAAPWRTYSCKRFENCPFDGCVVRKRNQEDCAGQDFGKRILSLTSTPAVEKGVIQPPIDVKLALLQNFLHV